MKLAEAPSSRMQVLELAGHNLDVVPSEYITLDLQSDSLIHKSFPSVGCESGLRQDQSHGNISVEKLFSRYFGFPHVIAVSQGRLAEAIFSRTMLRNGHYIPGSSLFSTTRVHQEQNGGTPVEVMSAESLDIASLYPFKGNINIATLEQVIQTHHPRWIPYICIEPCNNAVGGHPISLENMRAVADLARHYRIPVYLDACRIIDNALMIQEREKQYRNTPVDEIIREFCSYADGCTMSATKDFPTSIGGFFATRDPELFYRCIDQIALLGSGLSHDAKENIACAMENMDDVFARVRERINLVKKLHNALGENCLLAKPAGGHAVFLNVSVQNLGIPQRHNPERAFLYRLFRDYGIRGSVNPRSPDQIAKNISFVRFALPIVGLRGEVIEKAADDISAVLAAKDSIQGLEIVKKYSGLTGFTRSHYRPVR
ncbi:hypothetical protein H6G97_30405 [Nostoc flagelliforme FACHB-838]|uniref:Aromatic amino acid beta-eliminating lyase/threonine aldolase domain-containing protein n=1 Tax=Nostoc flagelliforme FACHB-838 TaxID=2692904 RepID=A0ABR8DW93_9NOSO|nr:beta-eliminating lyase-related protein [Nostoc flagelliforme]MBD2533631.1 hypothetical protein [Nostoc flagelliforme FACHB-838]